MADKKEDVEICTNCDTEIDSVLIIGDECFHACPYNNQDADFGVASFEQIPYGDQLNYGFSMAIWTDF